MEIEANSGSAAYVFILTKPKDMSAGRAGELVYVDPTISGGFYDGCVATTMCSHANSCAVLLGMHLKDPEEFSTGRHTLTLCTIQVRGAMLLLEQEPLPKKMGEKKEVANRNVRLIGREGCREPMDENCTCCKFRQMRVHLC